MPTLWGQRIFTVGDLTYYWEDLVLGGRFWGEWAGVEDRVRTGLACAARLDELDEDDEDAPEEAEVEAAAEEFRYAHDLASADDMEAWLQARGLTNDAWLEVVERALLLRRWAGKLETIVDEYEIEPEAVDTALACEALCGGLVTELAARLAARAAIYARSVATGDGSDAVNTGEIEATIAAAPASVLEQDVPGLPPAARRARLEMLARLDVVWRRFAAAEISREAVGSLIDAHRLEWIRVMAQVVTVTDEDVANEIALCVREDGMDLASAAKEAGASAVDARWYLDEIGEGVREQMISARPGDLVGPVAHEGGFVLISVVDKVLPAASDREIRARAERALLARTVDREVASRVTWHVTL